MRRFLLLKNSISQAGAEASSKAACKTPTAEEERYHKYDVVHIKRCQVVCYCLFRSVCVITHQHFLSHGTYDLISNQAERGPSDIQRGTAEKSADRDKGLTADIIHKDAFHCLRRREWVVSPVELHILYP